MRFDYKISLVGFILNLFYIPLTVKAANLGDWGKSLTDAGSKAGYKIDGTLMSAPETIIGMVINIFLSFIGVIFLVLLIYAGYLWMTARGNETQVTKAQSIMQAAVIGLIIVLLAYAITYFVIREFGTFTMTEIQ